MGRQTVLVLYRLRNEYKIPKSQHKVSHQDQSNSRTQEFYLEYSSEHYEQYTVITEGR
jgi:hypothetical protein